MTARTNAFELAAEMARFGASAQGKAVAITRHHTMLLETKIKAHASGRPGPRVVTGDYRRSWTSQVGVTVGVVIGMVGTNKPQARRLEFGFVGADALGRVYNQPPFPHAGPAYDEVAPGYVTALAGVLSIGGKG